MHTFPYMVLPYRVPTEKKMVIYLDMYLQDVLRRIVN